MNLTLEEKYNILLKHAQKYLACGCTLCNLHNNMKCPAYENATEKEKEDFKIIESILKEAREVNIDG